MKKHLQYLMSILPFFLVILITIFYILDNKKVKKSYNIIAQLKDSISRVEISNDYQKHLLEINQLIYSPLSDTCNGYELSDSEMKFPIRLNSLFNSPKKTLVIRYSSIGCNSCSDSSLTILKKNPAIQNQYNVLILVDFNNIEYLIKWKKISDVENKILFVKKGGLPFSTEQEEKSYIFIIDSTLAARSFFVPNSYYVLYIRDYYFNISQAY